MYTKLPEAQGRIIQTGSWVINGMPAGLGFREGKAGTFFEDMNPFLPHVVKGRGAPPLEFKVTSKQRDLRRRLYGSVEPKAGIYQKYGGRASVTVDDTIVDSKEYPAAPYSSHTEWPSYKGAVAVPTKFPSLTEQDIADLRVVKCFVESSGGSWKSDYSFFATTMAGRRVLQDASPALQGYLRSNPKFLGKKRRQSFGQIAKLARLADKGGRWFSVDNQGVVRTHFFVTAGFYRS